MQSTPIIERRVRLAIAAIKPVVDVQPSEPTASNKLELKKKKNYNWAPHEQANTVL